MKISAYTTTLNCLDRGYPFLECLEDLSSFADEVCVADGGSSDDTLNLIKESFPNVAETILLDGVSNSRGKEPYRRTKAVSSARF